MGAVDRSRYANREFDRRVLAAMNILDAPARERMLQEAIRVAMVDDATILTTHFQVNDWTMRRGLRHEGRADARSRPQDIRPAE